VARPSRAPGWSTAGLLTDRNVSDLAVNDILTAAGVSRGSFYSYFDSKHAVLGELVRRAVAQGHAAAAPWLANPADKLRSMVNRPPCSSTSGRPDPRLS